VKLADEFSHKLRIRKVRFDARQDAVFELIYRNLTRVGASSFLSALVEDYFGIQGMMDAEALARLMREAPAVNSVSLSLDAKERDRFYEAIKGLPTVSGMALQRVSLANFRAALAVLVTTMANIYTGLAAIIAFGVVYNGARISLSERARELASLRVLGFTRGEVMRILLSGAATSYANCTAARLGNWLWPCVAAGAKHGGRGDALGCASGFRRKSLTVPRDATAVSGGSG